MPRRKLRWLAPEGSGAAGGQTPACDIGITIGLLVWQKRLITAFLSDEPWAAALGLEASDRVRRSGRGSDGSERVLGPVKIARDKSRQPARGIVGVTSRGTPKFDRQVDGL